MDGDGDGDGDAGEVSIRRLRFASASVRCVCNSDLFSPCPILIVAILGVFFSSCLAMGAIEVEDDVDGDAGEVSIRRLRFASASVRSSLNESDDREGEDGGWGDDRRACFCCFCCF